MTRLTVNEAAKQLAQLIADAKAAELVILTDGDKEVALDPGGAFDLDEDTPELERELLNAADGPFTQYSTDEFRQVGEMIVRRKRGR